LAWKISLSLPSFCEAIPSEGTLLPVWAPEGSDWRPTRMCVKSSTEGIEYRWSCCPWWCCGCRRGFKGPKNNASAKLDGIEDGRKGHTTPGCGTTEGGQALHFLRPHMVCICIAWMWLRRPQVSQFSQGTLLRGSGSEQQAGGVLGAVLGPFGARVRKGGHYTPQKPGHAVEWVSRYPLVCWVPIPRRRRGRTGGHWGYRPSITFLGQSKAEFVRAVKKHAIVEAK